MHLLLQYFELQQSQEQNNRKQNQSLRAANAKSEINEGILIDGVNHHIGGIDRAALRQNVNLPKRLKCTDNRNDQGEEDGR